MVEIKKETHLVLKLEDIAKYLDNRQFMIFHSLVDEIKGGRWKDGKKTNSYYVCNTDEPYAQKVLDVIINGEREKEKQ